jgi:hypothetical protein
MWRPFGTMCGCPMTKRNINARKAEVQRLAQDNRATLINLENLVPADLWGTYVAQNIDFMHFQGKCHQLPAQALFSYVKNAHAEER